LSVFDWFKRRRTQSAKIVADFTRVARDQNLALDYDRDGRLAKLLSDDGDPSENLDEIAKLLGQTPEEFQSPVKSGDQGQRK
jgi:hypothetical protein